MNYHLQNGKESDSIPFHWTKQNKQLIFIPTELAFPIPFHQKLLKVQVCKPLGGTIVP